MFNMDCALFQNGGFKHFYAVVVVFFFLFMTVAVIKMTQLLHAQAKPVTASWPCAFGVNCSLLLSFQ